MATVLTAKLVSAVLLAAIAISSGTSAYLYQQASNAGQLQTQNASLQDQISTLNKQIDSLNAHISQLETLNGELGGNNSQLTSQVNQLQSQVSQLQGQVFTLTQTLNTQRSRVIANQVTVDRQTFTSTSNAVIALINIGTIQYSGYLRVSWTSPPRMNFGIQEFDVNITTPITASGVYSIPVSANATGNAWFQCWDYYFVNGVNVCNSNFTYSITYWY